MSDWPPCPVGNDNFGSHIPTIYPLKKNIYNIYIYIYIYPLYNIPIIYPLSFHSNITIRCSLWYSQSKNSHHDSPTRWSTMGAWSSQGTAQGYRISFETWPTFPWKARLTNNGWTLWEIWWLEMKDLWCLWLILRYGEGFGIFVFKIFIQIVLLLSFICWSLS